MHHHFLKTSLQYFILLHSVRRLPYCCTTGGRYGTATLFTACCCLLLLYTAVLLRTLCAVVATVQQYVRGTAAAFLHFLQQLFVILPAWADLLNFLKANADFKMLVDISLTS